MESITKKIKSITKKFETNNPFKIAKELGIEVVYEDLGRALGYYSRHFRVKVIHINQNANEQSKEFICAHELGHAICHPDANTPFLKKQTLFSTDRIELEANFFAINLLFASLNDCITMREAIEQYGIPEKFILYNLNPKNF
ncbi:ImmA/IrrE family metallo-endopeptidase [Bacillus licheniformis]|uniref:ImmA/IrrE family metallo-endopeptidase n=1 Tax=Bacillus licheniformis TaxID=1402 RepID=UPI00227EF8CC|nr:ImmA/IrrE family metallo-endopeptidase [Bacillus licheniformis]MCY7774064.1 ImmA/IrrE family metallo-endopeptidase [Bacillus licheniformis]MCY8159646.1 ImmA/IrrE family metallo-endopeptidase [Bacillus licheniformis]MCY8531143.1 ImmA/IrrE family metallo-endopeptidase [Bacillus licheniformis]MCY9284858.1 ImmA/IrrE family metallo-endopeptidase [Bacillus licheniformis]MEC1389055.1 ImmA/IrrE family metallo-endopeptidase [Bacillus licheniformis]